MLQKCVYLLYLQMASTYWKGEIRVAAEKDWTNVNRITSGITISGTCSWSCLACTD
jgi:hypothetical protein